MSDAYFDNLRDQGEYPRKGYGWCTEESQRKEIQQYINSGLTTPWIVREALKFRIIKDEQA